MSYHFININLASYILEFFCTLIIYFYGVPNQIDTGGEISLAAEQEDPEEKLRIRKYKWYGEIGLFCLIGSFLLQVFSELCK